jgi:SMODS-associating 2TM, beta-strand rich effector domain
MSNLTLTKAELTRLLSAFAWFSFGTFGLFAIMRFKTLQQDYWLSLRYMSYGITVATGALFLFSTWAWKWRWVARLMGRTVVHGVWAGRLQSDFEKEGANAVDLPIVFVIRQSYLTLSVRSLTRSQRGTSSLEALSRDEKTQDTHLSYVFKLDQPWVPGGKYGTGAGELQLEAGNTILRGMYWTDSPTHGTLRLKLVGLDVEGISSFEDAVRKFPCIRRD